MILHLLDGRAVKRNLDETLGGLRAYAITLTAVEFQALVDRRGLQHAEDAVSKVTHVLHPPQPLFKR